ncbi:MAG: hypothetical protein CVT49_00145 [candidate division Zixibacteria bacterium HGW-Zixibacteria-1]|nr:MAG: hypothetical protein CVT49_00145 [candidate division Zixibacteria bacterium HGW-Zixibacteria-1]
MADNKFRTQEQVFNEMHRELRRWNPEVPESPERLDPILKILLQLYSTQISRVDKKIDMVYEKASTSLIRSLCPESKRWPVPAFTVVRCVPTDPVVDVDQHTRFFYKEERDGGQTFFFSPHRKEKLVAAEVKHIYLKIDGAIVDLSPSSVESTSTHTTMQVSLPRGKTAQIYLAVDHAGSAKNFENANIFINGIPDALKQLRWGQWYPGSKEGRFHEDSGFCPGLTTSIEMLFNRENGPVNWGGLRSSADLFKPLENHFIFLPEIFVSTWEVGPPQKELYDRMLDYGITIEEGDDRFYWIRIDLPEGGNKHSMQSPFEIYFNCLVAINKNELTLFKHTGGNRLVEIELPEDISNILDILKVVDSNGREYIPSHRISTDQSQKFYSLEEKNNHLVLWFDFTGSIDLPPDSITINYSVTAGTEANGIEAGKIAELYENHPGIVSVASILPVKGAIPAKTDKQILTEVSARLRSRDRALSFQEISRWAMTFDPRILRAECQNGVERTDHGVRRCIVVTIGIKADDFYSNDEVELLRIRLNNFLKSRSPVNTQFAIKIEKK